MPALPSLFKTPASDEEILRHILSPTPDAFSLLHQKSDQRSNFSDSGVIVPDYPSNVKVFIRLETLNFCLTMQLRVCYYLTLVCTVTYRAYYAFHRIGKRS